MRTGRRLLCALTFGWTFGCAGVSTTTAYKIRQRGLTPGVSGPHAIGPVLEDGTYAVGVSAAAGFSDSTTNDRAHGASGDVVAEKAARLVFAAGVDRIVEVGASIDVRPGSLATAIASDVARSS